MCLPIAVFTRNYEHHLEKAASAAPKRLITFRSKKRWVKAREILDKQKYARLYIAPGRDGPIEYDSILKAIHLSPRKGEEYTERLLQLCLPGMEEEALWEDEVQTLYVITNCRKLAKPLPLSSLTKVDGGEPLSDAFTRTYAVVYELEDKPAADMEVYPDEMEEGPRFVEGAARRVYVNVYERDPRARAACIAYYGYDCSVCGFNFEKAFGDIGKEFVHVHHLAPPSKIRKSYEIDPIAALRPLCANCHAMIHKRDPAYSIDELRAIIAARGA